MLRRATGSRSLSPATIAVEALLIVLSILMALFVNEWREGRRIEAATRTSLANIHAEIERNLASVRRERPYHAATLARIDSFLSAPTDIPEGTAAFAIIRELAPDGLRPPLVQSTAWETARASQSLRIDYDLRYRLATVYKTQQVGVEATVPALLEALLNRDNLDPARTPLPTIRLMRILMQELVAQERTLEEIYGNALDVLAGSGRVGGDRGTTAE